MTGKPSRNKSFLAELQRRHVYKVGAMYGVGGWLLVQVVTQVFPFFDISNASVRWVVIAVVAGFPLALALVLAWLFDITPQGIVRTGDAPASGEPVAASRQRRGVERKLNYLTGLAQIEAQTGHVDEALALLQNLLAVPAGGVITAERLKLDPVWDPLRQDPRFQKLIAAYAVNKGNP